MKNRPYFSLLLFLPCISLAADFGGVSGAKQLLDAALNSPDGVATGHLVGTMADKMRAQFPGSKGIQLEARIVKKLAREGCARFNLVVTPAAMPEGAPRNMTMSMNWCRDGLAPEIGGGQP